MKKAIITLSILCGGLLIINPINNVSFAQNKLDQIEINADESETLVVEELNQNQAEDMLKMYNPDIEYIFQGDENVFKVLKERELEGYVFLGNIQGDLGYFVDKNSSNIYYFHPSGYLDIIL